MMTLFSRLVGKLIALLLKLLIAAVVLGVLGAIVYVTFGTVFGFIDEYWPIVVGLAAMLAFIGPELERLRYTMQRSHTDFMTQTKGLKRIDYQQDNESWDPYFTD